MKHISALLCWPWPLLLFAFLVASLAAGSPLPPRDTPACIDNEACSAGQQCLLVIRPRHSLQIDKRCVAVLQMSTSDTAVKQCSSNGVWNAETLRYEWNRCPNNWECDNDAKKCRKEARVAFAPKMPSTVANTEVKKPATQLENKKPETTTTANIKDKKTPVDESKFPGKACEIDSNCVTEFKDSDMKCETIRAKGVDYRRCVLVSEVIQEALAFAECNDKPEFLAKWWVHVKCPAGYTCAHKNAFDRCVKGTRSANLDEACKVDGDCEKINPGAVCLEVMLPNGKSKDKRCVVEAAVKQRDLLSKKCSTRPVQGKDKGWIWTKCPLKMECKLANPTDTEGMCKDVAKTTTTSPNQAKGTTTTPSNGQAKATMNNGGTTAIASAAGTNGSTATFSSTGNKFDTRCSTDSDCTKINAGNKCRDVLLPSGSKCKRCVTETVLTLGDVAAKKKCKLDPAPCAQTGQWKWAKCPTNYACVLASSSDKEGQCEPLVPTPVNPQTKPDQTCNTREDCKSGAVEEKCVRVYLPASKVLFKRCVKSRRLEAFEVSTTKCTQIARPNPQKPTEWLWLACPVNYRCEASGLDMEGTCKPETAKK